MFLKPILRSEINPFTCINHKIGPKLSATLFSRRVHPSNGGYCQDVQGYSFQAHSRTRHFRGTLCVHEICNFEIAFQSMNFLSAAVIRIINMEKKGLKELCSI